MNSDRCAKCRQVTTEFVLAPLSQNHKLKHYDTFSKLDASAAAGCDLCRLFRRALIHGQGFIQLSRATNISISTQQLEGAPSLFLACGEGDDWCFYNIRTSSLEDGLKPIRRLKAQNRRVDLKWLARERIKPWIETCKSGPVIEGRRTHASCNIAHGGTGPRDQYEKPPLPSRVIDLGVEGDIPRLYVPQLENGSAVFADYLILSYCWGEGNTSARTTRDNFADRRRGINMDELPQTILDAIAVSRAMGQRYLFVDAVCIIQHNEGEDPTDWLLEAPLMGRYYQNALCTIAATAPLDSRDGFLSERPAEIYPVGPVSLGPWTDLQQNPREITLQPSIPLWANDVAESSLYSRGWTLQERTVSNRVLHFGRDAVYWECGELRASEFLPNGLGRRISLQSAPWITSEIHQQLESLKQCSREDALGREWFQLASRYSRMDFTYNKDKLVAIQGVVDRIRLFFPDRYVAGCFESQLIPSIAWYAAGDEPKVKIRSQGIAPTWSWVSATIPPSFVSSGPYNQELQAKLISVEDYPINPQLVSSSPAPKGALVINGLVRSAQLVRTGREEEFPNLLYFTSRSLDGYPLNPRIFFDHMRLCPATDEFACDLISIVTRVNEEGFLMHGCLVIRQISGNEQTRKKYERLGWAEFTEIPGLPGWSRSDVTIL